MNKTDKTNWQTKKLGEVCDIGAGNSAPQKKEYFVDGVYPFFRTSDIGQIHIGRITESSDYLNEKGIKGLKLFNKGTILLPKSGASTFLNHRVVLDIDGYVSSHLATVKTDEKVLNNNYLFYFLQEVKAQDLIQDHKYPSLNLPVIGNIEISYPKSLPEQHRIVKILDEVFADVAKAKENAEKNLQNSKELFESYLQRVFANPGHDWEEKRLGEAYDVRDGTHDSPKYQKEGYALITSKNLKRDELDYQKIKYISEKDYKKINERSKVHKGDILFAMIGTIGNPVVIKTEPDFAIKNVALFKIPKEQNSYFLKYFLDSKFVIDKMMSEAKGTTQKFVGLGYLRNFKIQLPKLDEQKSIVAKLDALSAETRKLETIYQQKLTDLEELKKSVLKRAFNGDL
ncbi:MAG: restriction endonuclease subunit S [Patescibacteria group bacterium]